MRRLLRRLDGYWFAEAPAARLAALRILIGAYALAYLGWQYDEFLEVAGTSRALFDPAGVVALLDAPIPAEAFRILLILTLVAGVPFLLGWQYRYAGPLFAGLLLWVMCYRNSWSMVYHSHNLLVLHALILGLTPAADALSLDSLRRRSAQPRAPLHGWEYGYPVRLICTVTVITYFLAAVAKVMGPLGWSWATGEALRDQVAYDGLRKELLDRGATALTLTLNEHLWLFTAIGVASMVIELGAPAALPDARLGRLWAASAFLMHWGIYVIMGITFRYHLSGVVFASFFDLERVVAWVRPRYVRERFDRARSRLWRRHREPADAGMGRGAGRRAVLPAGRRLLRPVVLATALLVLVPSSLVVTGQVMAPARAVPPAGGVLDGTTDIDEQALADLAFERAQLGAQWLANAVRPDGAYYYGYDPVRDRYETTDYNEVRHAGTTYALFQVYGAGGAEDLREPAERAAAYIDSQSRAVAAGGRAFAYKGVTKLGGQALALVALLERRRVTGDTAYDPLIGDLATFMLSLERQDRPGQYFHKYDVNAGRPIADAVSSFYPGEALLALTRLAVAFPDGPYLDAATRAANYLVHERDGDLPTLGRIRNRDHWLTMALSELYRLTPDPDYATVAYLQGDSMLRDQYEARHGRPELIGAARGREPIGFTGTATRGEALVAAWGLAGFRGDQDAAARFATGARRNVQFQMRVQHTAENTGQFPRPDRVIGGWGQNATRPYVQIDYVQHNISALIGVWYLTETGELPIGPSSTGSESTPSR
ncbi:MAG: hypothetical protein M3O34_20075 [Chloroflexota bacterium]|nr:hypothetical protein [Chloroflexota bacterium]